MIPWRMGLMKHPGAYLGLLGVAAAAFIVAYVGRFAPEAHWRFSQSPEDWARFGEYVGGVFAILAFIGVLITVDLQRRQLSLLTSQATIDELLRICRDLASNVDNSLQKEIILEKDTVIALSRRRLPKTLGSVLRLTDDALLEKDIGRSMVGMILRAAHGSSIQQSMVDTCAELDLLARCISDATERGCSSVIQDYYRARYRDSVRRMRIFDGVPASFEFWL